MYSLCVINFDNRKNSNIWISLFGFFEKCCLGTSFLFSIAVLTAMVLDARYTLIGTCCYFLPLTIYFHAVFTHFSLSVHSKEY
jgi:hypothetical protein